MEFDFFLNNLNNFLLNKMFLNEIIKNKIFNVRFNLEKKKKIFLKIFLFLTKFFVRKQKNRSKAHFLVSASLQMFL